MPPGVTLLAISAVVVNVGAFGCVSSLVDTAGATSLMITVSVIGAVAVLSVTMVVAEISVAIGDAVDVATSVIAVLVSVGAAVWLAVAVGMTVHVAVGLGTTVSVAVGV